MARRRRPATASFEDLPIELRPREAETRKQAEARYLWLEEHDLSVVDYFGWLRAQDPLAALRPPARRKLMSAEQLAALDARLEQEGIRRPG